ncbi:MAG: glycogen synthase [Candidatus Saganbacteria bacterium]|nr:glycogen synthase [Candidatus Saganbacteria bacterium]
MRIPGRLKIWMVTPEMHRIKKTGGLADAVTGMCEGLVNLGHNVTTVMPKHNGTLEFFLRNRINPSHFCDLNIRIGDLDVKSEVYKASIKHGDSRINFFFVDTVDCLQFGNRTKTYGYKDDPYRFFFLDRAVHELYIHIAQRAAAKAGMKRLLPHVIHGHDWQSGFTPFFLKRDPQSAKVPFVYSIHNLGYGFANALGLPEFSHLTGIPMNENPDLFSWNKGIEFYGLVRSHKVAIMYSDILATVSREHARELMAGETPPPGNLYEGVFAAEGADVRGIINGLPDYFRPQHFHEAGTIPANFSAENQAGRAINRAALQGRFNLPQREDAMIVVSSSRIAWQKGIDVVARSLSAMLRKVPGAQYIFIGDGEEEHIRKLQELSGNFGSQVRYVPFNEELEMLALAGGDAILMPSRYEPCGLNQMKGHMLGCLPIANETGGLKDTVIDGQTGFTFRGVTKRNLVRTIDETWQAFQARDRWADMIGNCMLLDYSWTTRAEEYVELYREALKAS